MTQSLLDAFKELNGDNNKFENGSTVLQTVDSLDLAVARENSHNTNEDEDIFQCGKCKQQFFSIGTFMAHKKTHHLGGDSLEGQQLVGTDLDPELQLQQTGIILGENGIFAFTIPSVLPGQDLQGFEECEAIIPDGIQSQDQTDINGPLDLNSAQIILTSQIDGVNQEVPLESLLLTNDVTDAEDTFSLEDGQSLGIVNQFIVTTSSVEEENVEMNSNPSADKENARSRRNSKVRNCIICQKVFYKASDLRQHMRAHTGERPYQCVVCGKAFTQKSNVKKHMDSHRVWPHLLKTLPEVPIKKITSDNSGETIIVDQSFSCQYCPDTFSSFFELKRHRKVHVDCKVFKCIQPNCHEAFDNLNSFLGHIESHQVDTRYSCPKCHVLFNSLDQLSLHGPCDSRKSCLVRCKICKAKFSSQIALKRHQADESHSYPCSECSKVFRCERHLRRHLVTHSSVPLYSCSKCGKAFTTAQNASQHLLTHSSEKPFVCKVCGRTFGRQDRLTRHALIHEPHRRFKCPFSKRLGCTKEFHRKDKLKLHIMSHSSSPSLECKRCNRVFKRTPQLKQHQTVCLAEDKPCKDCGHVTSRLDHYKKSTKPVKAKRYGQCKSRPKLGGSTAADVGASTLQVIVVEIPESTSKSATIL